MALGAPELLVVLVPVVVVVVLVLALRSGGRGDRSDAGTPSALEGRLAELDRLQARGVISAQERDAARARLLGELQR